MKKKKDTFQNERKLVCTFLSLYYVPFVHVLNPINLSLPAISAFSRSREGMRVFYLELN